MKRSRQTVGTTQTGDTSGDGGTQGINWQNKGGRNATTDASRRGAGQVAPRPQNSKQPYLGSSAHTGPVTASMARVKDQPSAPTGKLGPAGSFTPVQNNALANLTGQATGQAEVNPRGAANSVAPKTRTPLTNHPVATTKPKRKGLGANFYGEY